MDVQRGNNSVRGDQEGGGQRARQLISRRPVSRRNGLRRGGKRSATAPPAWRAIRDAHVSSGHRCATRFARRKDRSIDLAGSKRTRKDCRRQPCTGAPPLRFNFIYGHKFRVYNMCIVKSFSVLINMDKLGGFFFVIYREFQCKCAFLQYSEKYSKKGFITKKQKLFSYRNAYRPRSDLEPPLTYKSISKRTSTNHFRLISF